MKDKMKDTDYQIMAFLFAFTSVIAIAIIIADARLNKALRNYIAALKRENKLLKEHIGFLGRQNEESDALFAEQQNLIREILKFKDPHKIYSDQIN